MVKKRPLGSYNETLRVAYLLSLTGQFIFNFASSSYLIVLTLGTTAEALI